MRFSLLCPALAALIVSSAWSASSQVDFVGLGDLTGGADSSYATGVSGDGSTVSGFSSSTDGTEPFKWTEALGLSVLDDTPGGNISAGAKAVSQNGNFACGFGTVGIGIIRATRWDGLAAPIQLGTINSSGYLYSQASGISADGTKIVGISSSANGLRAFLWESGSGMSDLGILLPNPSQSGDFSYNSSANAISSDGQVVTGASSYTVSTTVTIDPPPIITYKKDENGQIIQPPEIISIVDYPPYDQTTVLEQGTEAFSWTSAGGMIHLGDLPGGSLFSEANAISADGTIIVGGGQHDTGEEGIVWTNGVIEAIGDLDGGTISSVLNDVVANGTIAVGQGTDAIGSAALLWSSEFGIGNLNTLLEDQGVNLGGWRLTSATGISDDGQVIVGDGINPSGDPEGWRISNALTLLNILVPPPEGLQESMSVFRGTAALFTAERGRDYQLLKSTNLANWTPEGATMSTANAGGDFTHALPISNEGASSFFLLGPSTVASEADTSISIFDGTLLGYTSERGYIYQAEYSDDLITWLPFDSPLDSSSDSGPVDRVFIDTSAPPEHQQRFYRIDTVQTGILTVPFDLNIGYFAGMEMPVGTEFQLRIKIGADPYIDYGPPFSVEGAATAHYYYAPITFPPPILQLVTLPTGDPYFNQNVLALATGAVVSFTSQPGSTYQVQRSTDGVTFTNLGDSIDCGSDTGTALRMILDSFDPTSPPANVSYRVVETPPAP